jgi:hypothetical protein
MLCQFVFAVQQTLCPPLCPSLSLLSLSVCLSGCLSLVCMHTMHVTHTHTGREGGVDMRRHTPYTKTARGREEGGYVGSCTGYGEGE